MNTTKFDIADYLDNNEMIAEYLDTILEEENDSDIIVAIRTVAKAIGMTKIAEETGLVDRVYTKPYQKVLNHNFQ